MSEASGWDRVRRAGPRVPTSVSVAITFLIERLIIVVAPLLGGRELKAAS